MHWLRFISLVVVLLCAANVWAQAPSATASAPSEPSTAANPAPSDAAPAPSVAESAQPATRPSPPFGRRAQSRLDRSTPRQTVLGLLRAVEDGELTAAAQHLDLQGVQWETQTPGTAAKQLAELLTFHMWLNPDSISDATEGDPADGKDIERIGSVRVRRTDVAITLTRVDRGGQSVWLFSRQTVAQLPELMGALDAPAWLEDWVPDSVESVRVWGMWGWQWLALAVALILGYPIGFFAASLTLALLMRLAGRTSARWDDAALRAVRVPARVALGLGAFFTIALSVGLPGRVTDILRTWVSVPIILTCGWAVMRATRAVIDVFMTSADEDSARQVRTHLLILRRVASATIAFVTISLALIRFEIVRDLGLSLLASAGVAGVALGFAAQKSLGAVIAGLQLSITQPVRLGDAIVWQGQWGEVEEITLTWVRLKLFDERRLIVPVEKFLVEPFENWSMPGDEMIGLIEIPIDATAPVEKIRAELQRLADEHPLHDGRDCRLQLMELSAGHAMLRARVSTNNMMETLTMRCELREQLMQFLGDLDDGRYLVRQRWQHLDGVEESQAA